MEETPPNSTSPEKTILQSRVPSHGEGKTLLAYLAGRFRYQSQDDWEKKIIRGEVTLNEKPSTPLKILQPGDCIAYQLVLKEPPVNKDIKLLYEEKSFLVATKPGNLPSHADGNYIKNTFIYLLTQTLRQKGWRGDVRLVHRLDRETSGLMVVAKDKECHRMLSGQFEKGEVRKEYLALAQGTLTPGTFEVDGPIGRSTQSQISIRRQVLAAGTPGARPSRTLFETLQHLGESTLLRCVPQTGRTNQIRVHLESIGHPILGDRLYGRSDEEFLEFVRAAKKGNEIPPAPGGAPRLMLHAHRLSFRHPITEQRVEFESPLPQDIILMIEHLKKLSQENSWES
jgi:RluA family pseudouridine synthase